jgi:ABC-type sugar transport system substrate-binding protein
VNFNRLPGTKPSVDIAALKAERPYRLALVVKNRVNPAYLSAMKAGDDAAAHYGIEVEHFVPSTPDDLEQQNALLDAILDGGFDAMLVTPVDADAQVDVFKRFNAAGVPIHNFSNAITGAEVATFVASDDVGIGVSVIETLAGLTQDAARICVVAGSPTTPTARDRLEGVHRGLEAHKGLVVLEEAPAFYDRSKAHDLVLLWLTTHSEVDAIVALNDEMALGAIEALESVGRQGVIVTGVNGTPEGLLAVQAGRLAFSVDYALYTMTQTSVELAIRNLNGERLETQDVSLQAEVITPANVEAFIGQRHAWGIM